MRIPTSNLFDVLTNVPCLSAYAYCLARDYERGFAQVHTKLLGNDSMKMTGRLSFNSTVSQGTQIGGLENVILFDEMNGHLREEAAIRRVKLTTPTRVEMSVWGQPRVLRLARCPLFPPRDTLETSTIQMLRLSFRNGVSILLQFGHFAHPKPFRCGCSRIDRKLNVQTRLSGKSPFDLAHWQKVAAEKYPHGLPKPFSSDPTQWLFNGHPNGADQPLQVAVARLLGYQWPRQTGSSFPDCPALGPDGLEKLADDDGIVCLPSVRGEAPAAERLRQLLAAAYGKDWKAHTELELIRASGSEATDLEEWLRNDFFEQHCDYFPAAPVRLAHLGRPQAGRFPRAGELSHAGRRQRQRPADVGKPDAQLPGRLDHARKKTASSAGKKARTNGWPRRWP